MKVIEGVVATPNARVAIAIARFNNFINDSLLEGAIDALKRIGQVADDNITVVLGPGRLRAAADGERIGQNRQIRRGYRAGHRYPWGTAHFEYVAGEASSGIGNVAMNAEIPVAFGVLTTESIEQAIERAGTKAGNKGAEAALTALEMINVIKAIKA